MTANGNVCYVAQAAAQVRILALSANSCSSKAHIGTMKICVCICTFKRPARVGALLRTLGEQVTEGEFTMSVVVCDNDSARSAQAAVKGAAASLSFPVSYCVEPEQNIAKARNRALHHSAGDFIAFIDDDEIPSRDWLLTALRTCLAHAADGVLAPVRPLFEHAPPAWLLKGRFCERAEHPTGHQLSWRETRTGNVLMRRSLIEGSPEPFDTAYGNGGEDTDFFKRLMANGARFVWCNEAAVHEVVPPDRCERRYLLKRAVLRGQNEKHLATLASVGKSLVAVPIYIAALPFVLFAGQHWVMHVGIRLCDHAGKLAGVLGFRPLGKKYITSTPQE
jgi:succinoglycan biosynthesis protein ExoM